MKIGLLGDTHGQTRWTLFALWNFHYHGIDTIVQLGDFGISNTQSGHAFLKRVRLGLKNYGQTMYVVPGNHEDYDYIHSIPVNEDGWQELRNGILLAPRGHRWQWEDTSFVALGGAASVDRHWRTNAKGSKSWWAEEALMPDDVTKVAEGGYADIMVSHDAPFCRVIDEKIRGNPLGFKQWDLEYAHENRKLFDQAFHAVAPKAVIHGHYHFPVQDTVEVVRNGETAEALVVGLDCDNSPRSMGSLDTETGVIDLWDVREDLARYTTPGSVVSSRHE